MHWFTIFAVLISGAYSQEPPSPTSAGCPRDIVRQAMKCFSDLASGVTKGRPSQFTGSMPLDYHLIREYCQEGGHMTQFLQCIDNLQKQCENAQEAEVLLQIINPDRVRTSVPNLCSNIDLVEASADCLNREMTQDSTCKNSAKEMIKKGMSQTPRNVTAMFIVQCRFFNILAECQRVSVRENCGERLANLHADFILSFVPNTCAKDGKNSNTTLVSTGEQTTNKPMRTSEETATMLGVFPANMKTNSSHKTEESPSEKKKEEKSKEVRNKEPEQVLKTLPPFVKDNKDDQGGLKSKRHLDDEAAKTTSSGVSVQAGTVTVIVCILNMLQ